MDQVFVIKVRANDVTWDEAQRLNGALAAAAKIAVKTVAEHNLGREVEVVAPHVVHRSAKTPRGFFKEVPSAD